MCVCVCCMDDLCAGGILASDAVDIGILSWLNHRLGDLVTKNSLQ